MSRKHLILIVKGFCMGSADVVPGVSGGTMAFILGIYPRLINAIKLFDLDWLKAICSFDVKQIINKPDFVFLIPLGIGIVAGLFFFTRIIPLPVLIKTYPFIIYGFFFGLIFGSILFLVRQLGLSQLLKESLFLLLGFLFGFFIVTRVPASTPNDSWFIFICGTIAISAMILPGISGSLILLMMKKYAYIFNAIGHLQFNVLLPFVAGLVVGVVLFSHLLSFLLSRFYEKTILFITGLLIASMYVVWPFQYRQYEVVRDQERLIQSVPYIPAEFNVDVLSALLMMFIGLVLVIGFEIIANRTTEH